MFPIITDPWFYAVALPAVFLMGVSKSGFGSGFGSLVVPIMALSVPVPQAAAIMLPLLLVMDLMGLAAFRQHVDRQWLRFMLPWALLGTLIGTVLFGLLDPKVVAAIVGASISDAAVPRYSSIDCRPNISGGAAAIRRCDSHNAVSSTPGITP